MRGERDHRHAIACGRDLSQPSANLLGLSADVNDGSRGSAYLVQRDSLLEGAASLASPAHAWGLYD
jgi:TPP-dependent pyruvate/acetoin dehydrogenase alpha subunit